MIRLPGLALIRPRISRPRVRPPRSWEEWAYVGLIVVALGTRLWDLGGRTLHYDELLHAWYSWRYAEGLGYSHTPMTHGPFLFHSAAATFTMLGSNDFTVRLLPSLFGTALVGTPYLLRRELGRFGALATAGFFLISPSLLYFGRFIRNDMFMALWAMAMLAIIFRYVERPRTSLLFGWAILWALAYSTKESAYLLAGMFGLLLFVAAAPSLWDWARGRRRLADVSPPGDLLIVLGTLSLPLWAPVTGLVQKTLGIVLVNPDMNDPRIESGEIIRAAAETGAPVGGALYIAGFILLVFIGLSISIGLLWDRRRWPLLAASFATIWLALFTSLFTNWQGFFTGFWGSLGYWIAQQAVERASQPWYYYIVGLWVYESLVLAPALIGSVYLIWRRQSAFDGFIVCWAALNFVLFTIAGEKMPWLLVGLTVPFALVAGRTIGPLVEKAVGLRWNIWPYVAGIVFGSMIPYAIILVVLFDNFTSHPGFWVALVAITATSLTLVILARRQVTADRASPLLSVAQRSRLRPKPVSAALVLGGLTVLAGLTAVTAGRASYSYGGFERPKEMFVYSQTGQETTYASQCLSAIATGSSRGHGALRVFVDESDNFAWQWRWYLRDYKEVTYRSLHDAPFEEPPEFDVIMMSRAVEKANEEQLKGFDRSGELHHLWWFPNYTYGGLTPSRVASGATSRDGWRTTLDYLLRREMGTSMQRSFGVIYVETSLATHAAGCTDLRATSAL